MEALATLTADAQVTIPAFVRDALGIEEGDHVVFRVEGNRAILTGTPNFLRLAGGRPPPAPPPRRLEPRPSGFKVVE